MSKLLFVAALAITAAVVVAKPHHRQPQGSLYDRAAFGRWMDAYGKVYDSEALYERAFASWLLNAKYVEAHAQKTDATYTVGLNQFADLSGQDWKDWVASQGMGAGKLRHKPATQQQHAHGLTKPVHSKAPPTAVDWRALAGPIWNQGECGASPFFGAVDPVTVLWAQQTGLVIPLSVQEVVDCSSAEGNYGCDGGFMTDTFQWIIDNKGICSDQEYPYTATGPNTCLASNCTNVARITGFQQLGTDETALVAVVATVPVATAVDATCQSFQLYTSGVVNDPTCTSTAQPDHGISIFGYGTDKGVDYWTLRNSWTATWGEQGYIRLIRGKNQCGLNEYLSYPTLNL